jgi:hypothetical protein
MKARWRGAVGVGEGAGAAFAAFAAAAAALDGEEKRRLDTGRGLFVGVASWIEAGTAGDERMAMLLAVPGLLAGAFAAGEEAGAAFLAAVAVREVGVELGGGRAGVEGARV